MKCVECIFSLDRCIARSSGITARSPASRARHLRSRFSRGLLHKVAIAQNGRKFYGVEGMLSAREKMAARI